MVSPHELANQISAILPKYVALRCWGVRTGYGNPYEGYYTLVKCDAMDDCLRLHFDRGELLAVWNPVDLKFTETGFEIGDAKAIRWTSYFGIHIPENLHYKDYARGDEGIVYRTNEETVRGTGWLPPDADSYPAVDLYEPGRWSTEENRRDFYAQHSMR